MKRFDLENLIEEAAYKAKEGESRIWYIVEALERNGFIFKINDEYQQFPVDQKQARKLARVCKHPDCLKRPRAHGFCQTHYLQARRLGLLGEQSECSVEGCTKPVEAKGLCFTHYRKATRVKLDQ
jgi:hypothetical protein